MLHGTARIRETSGKGLPAYAGMCAASLFLVVLVTYEATSQETTRYNRDVGPRDWPQLGGSPHRNNAPRDAYIPTEWEVGSFDETGRKWRGAGAKNIKWTVPLGSQTYGNVVVANGKVFVGTNNAASYLARFPSTVDLGVLLCFRESDGQFLWQYSSEKLRAGRVHDWPFQGICSAPVAEGNRLWFVTNRGEVVCLDAEGFYDQQDDGPTAGVWRSIEIQANAGDLNEAFAAGPINYEIREFLWPLAKRAHQATDFRSFERAAQPNEWFAKSFQDERLFRVTLGASTLTVAGLEATTAEPMEFERDLVSGLDRGQMTESLRAELQAREIELSDDFHIAVDSVGKAWTITQKAGTQSIELGLEQDGSRLFCRQRLTQSLEHEADIVWSLDMMKQLGVRQHNMATCAPTIWGDVLFLCTSNGVDESHENIPAPDAPSFLALDKRTGEVLWMDNSPGKNILHGQWSCPAAGVFDGVPQVIFPGGDGWLYSFRADRWSERKPELLWKFDGNPKESFYQSGRRSNRNVPLAVPVIYDGLVYMAMGEDPAMGEGEGHLWCIDPTKRGDVSAELVVDEQGQQLPHQRLQANAPIGDLLPRVVPNPNSAAVWHYEHADRNGNGKADFEEQMHRSIGSPAIKNDLLFITDFSGLTHCLNAKTGEQHWTCDLLAACWTTPLIAGERIYVGDEDGEIAILSLSPDPQVSVRKDPENLNVPRREIAMPSSIYTMPVAANNVLYIAIKNRLFAIAQDGDRAAVRMVPAP